MRSRTRPTRRVDRVVARWGYVGQAFVVPRLRVRVRPGTTDDKVIDEVLVRNHYQNRAAGVGVDADDVWLDLGGNIGTFALLALSAGGRVVSVEPEPENAAMLRANLAANFATGHAVVEAGVGLRAGRGALRVCNGSYNKYRHSFHDMRHWNAARGEWRAARPREVVRVPVVTLASLLDRYPGINAIKMDIEGSEIPLLESLDARTCAPIRKLVFEYTFDVDPSIPRFLAITDRLRRFFSTVHHNKIDARQREYRHYPPCITVYCRK